MHSALERYCFTAGACLLALTPYAILGRSGAATSLLLFVMAVFWAAWQIGAAAGIVCAVGAVVGVDVAASISTHASHAVLSELSGFLLASLAATFAGSLLRRQRSDFVSELAVTRAVASGLHEGVCTIDARGRITSLNPAAERALGWDEADALGRDAAGITLLPASHIGETLRLGAPLRGIDPRGTRHDGTPIDFELIPVMDGDRTVGAVLTLHDSDERKLVQAHRAGEFFSEGLVNASPDSVIIIDLYGFVTAANSRAAELHGFERAQDMKGRRLLELFAKESGPRLIDEKQRAITEGGTIGSEFTSMTKDGSTFPSEISTASIRDSDGNPQAIVVAVRDMTRRKELEDSLRASQERVQLQHAVAAVLGRSTTIGEAVPDVIDTMGRHGGWDAGVFWTLDADAGVLRCYMVWTANGVDVSHFAGVSQQLVCSPGTDLPGRVWTDGEPMWILEPSHDRNYSRAPAASEDGLQTAFCFPVRSSKGLHAVVELYSREVRAVDEDLMHTVGAIGGAVGRFMQRQHAEKALEHRALHDSLTNLPNRVLFQERLERALSATRTTHATLALLILDLDGFKEVNDALGHHNGDVLLQQVGLRLDSLLRESDTVARLGGDEFAVLLPSTDETGARLVSSKILRSLEQSFMIDGHHAQVGASIGIAHYPQHGSDASVLMRRADAAMYRAKRGSMGYATYEPHEDKQRRSDLTINVDGHATVD